MKNETILRQLKTKKIISKNLQINISEIGDYVNYYSLRFILLACSVKSCINFDIGRFSISFFFM